MVAGASTTAALLYSPPAVDRWSADVHLANWWSEGARLRQRSRLSRPG